MPVENPSIRRASRSLSARRKTSPSRAPVSSSAVLSRPPLIPSPRGRAPAETARSRPDRAGQDLEHPRPFPKLLSGRQITSRPDRHMMRHRRGEPRPLLLLGKGARLISAQTRATSTNPVTAPPCPSSSGSGRSSTSRAVSLPASISSKTMVRAPAGRRAQSAARNPAAALPAGHRPRPRPGRQTSPPHAKASPASAFPAHRAALAKTRGKLHLDPVHRPPGSGTARSQSLAGRASPSSRCPARSTACGSPSPS